MYAELGLVGALQIKTRDFQEGNADIVFGLVGNHSKTNPTVSELNCNIYTAVLLTHTAAVTAWKYCTEQPVCISVTALHFFGQFVT